MKKLLVSDKSIKDKIYEIRGKQVMLDSDLAELYEVGTKRINEAVKNNPLKFPQRFSWILTKDELELCSWSKNSTLNDSGNKRGYNIKYMPRVFTEQGVAMLATILKSKKAVEVSIGIMDAFVAMRHYLSNNNDIYQTLNYLNNKLLEHDDKINDIFIYFDKKEKLFLNGTVYDAYSYVHNLIKNVSEELIIVDPYADLKLLDMIRDIDSKTILITSNKASLSKLQIDLFNEQYNKLVVFKDNSFHDRYLIIDKKKIYHIGTSINYLGKKIFSIVKLEDAFVKDDFMKYIKNIIDK